MPHHRLSKAIVSQVGEFVQTLGEGCAKPSQKFLRAMLLGMAMSGSVLLSQSARKLKGLTSLTFHAQHKKLCRDLKSKRWAALSVQEAYLKEAGKFLPRNAMVACDLGDITKPRARKMPGIRQTAADALHEQTRPQRPSCGQAGSGLPQAVGRRGGRDA